MKLSTNRYNVMLEKDGKRNLEGYYGYTSKKQAEARAESWRKAGFKAEVIDRRMR